MRPAAHRALALDAQRVLRHLRDHPRDAGLWGEPAFAREVDRIRHHLAPIREPTVAARVVLARGVPFAPTDGSTSEAASGTRLGERPPPPPPEPPTPCAGWSWATADRGRDGPSSSPGAPDASEEPRPLSFADAPVPALLHDAPRRSGRRRDAVAPAAAPGRLRPPARLRDLLAAAARQAGQRARRAGHPRGAWTAIGGQEMEMPVVHPADIWRASGRYDAIGPELARFKDRNGRDMVLAMTHEEVVGLLLADIVQLVAPAADAGLPLPDEVARRAARPRRAHPRPRVRDEGRLQLRPRRRPGSTSATRRSTARTSGSSSGSGSRPSSSRPTSGSWAAARPTSSWSSTRPARTSSSCARRAATPPTARSRSCPSPSAARRGAAAARGGRDARARRRSRRSPRSSGSAPERTAKAAFFVTGDGRLVTAIVRGDYEVNETKLGNAVGGGRRASGRPRSRRSRRPGWSPATARRSAPTTRSSSSTTSSRARRTSSPARTARASTTATSTSAATSRPTSSPTSRTPRRAMPARPAASP